METIVLNKKTKKIMWKRIILTIILCGIMLGIGFLIGSLRIRYQYFAIDKDGNKTILGVSANNKLVENALMEDLNNVKKAGFEIADYNITHIVNHRAIITWRSNKTNTQEIKSTIEDYIYSIVYALEIDINGKTYILPPNKVKEVREILQSKDKKLTFEMPKGVFVREEEVLDQAAIDNLISNYKVKSSKKK